MLDSSLSMRARDARGETRFEKAKKAAGSWMKTGAARNSYSIFTSSPRLRQIGQKEQSEAEAAKSIAALQASLSSDNLDSAVAELAQSGDLR